MNKPIKPVKPVKPMSHIMALLAVQTRLEVHSLAGKAITVEEAASMARLLDAARTALQAAMLRAAEILENGVQETPVLTAAQADRIIGGLDPNDGGHDEIAAFIAKLAEVAS